jgi:hypothetical protein
MSFLPAQTTGKEEEILGRTASSMAKKGYTAHIICRNEIDVALATIAVHQVRLSDKFMRAASSDGRYAVIGTRSDKDDRKLRDRMQELRTAVGYGR